MMATTLPALIDKATASLAGARTSAEVLEARDNARVAYDAAKSAGRMARAKRAHDDVISAVYRAQADALLIEARAKVRLADEYDDAQRRGEVRLPNNEKTTSGAEAVSAGSLGLTHKQVHEARQIRDAEKAEPGLAERALRAMIKRGEEPTRTELQRAVLIAAKAIRAEKAATSRAVRLDNLAEISRGNRDLATDVKYPIIYADPPWRYENPPIGATSRAIENHYPTMTLAEICALPVGELATDDALLYLWATAPKLAECFEVIRAWGFEYRTNMVWDKEKIGMGYHARNQHELLLICKRGNIPPPAAGTQPSSVYREPRGAHSAKPTFYHEMIEAAYPQLPRIELFCRSPRDGWAVWGNQSEAA